MAIWRRVASQTLAIFAVRLVGAGLVLFTQAMMTRTWGASTFAEYLLIISAVGLAATIMPLGYQVVGGYFAAEYRAYQTRAKLQAFMRKAYGHIAVVGCIFLAGCQIWAVSFADPNGVFGKVWLPTLVLSIAVAVVFVNGTLLIGLQRPFTGFVADTLFRPVVILAGFVVAATMVHALVPLQVMLWSAAIGYGVVAAVHFAAVLKAVNALPETGSPVSGESRRWWRLALPWMAITLATDLFFEIDLVLLSFVMSREELAIFGVCTRVFSLLAFGVGAIYSVTMPDILEAGAQRNEHEFCRRIGDANMVATAFALLLAVVMLGAGPVLGLIFGDAFSAGSIPLAILCLALVVRSFMGPASLVLSFHDRPYASLPAAGFGLVMLVLGNLVLVPALGLNGAALSALLAISLWSVSLRAVVLREVHLDISIMPRLKDLLARRAA